MEKDGGFYLRKALVALLANTIVFILPVGAVLLRAFSDYRGIVQTFTDPYTWRILGFTILQATLSALFSVLLALPFAIFFSRYTFKGRRAILTISDAAFALPAILAVLGFVIYYGNNGILNNILKNLSNNKLSVKILYSFKAIILAHVYLNFPVAFSLITTSLSSMPDKEEMASRLLGASEIKTFFKVTLPKAWGMIVSTFTLIFLFCFPSFLIVMSLGGNPRYYTIEAEIYKRTFRDVNPASSAALAIFSFLVMTLLLVISGYGKEEKKVSRNQRILKKTKGKERIWAIILCFLIFLFIAPPLLSILYRAFFTKDNTFTLKAWQSIARRSSTGAGTSIGAIINSLLIALSSSYIAMKMATSISMAAIRNNSRFIALLTSLPMAVGSVSLGLGFSFITAVLPIRNIIVSYAMVLLSHIVIIMPFAVRTIMPGAKRIPKRLSLCAKTMGSSDKDIYRKIEYPLLKDYRRRALAFSFALSLGEVNATLTLSEGKVTTIPILIYKMINQYNYQGASALAVILLLVAIIVFGIGETGGKDYGLS